MLAFLAENPLIALVIILALGFAIGKIRLGGMSLGTAAILFVAIIFSTLDPNIQLPPLLFQFGLAIFVYAIGLTAGHAFFADFRRRGWRMLLFVVVLLVGLMGMTWLLVPLFGVEAATATGSFAAALTSTPGMAAVVDMLEGTNPELAAHPVVGYSLAYPGGVLGAIAVAVRSFSKLTTDRTLSTRTFCMLHWSTVASACGTALRAAYVTCAPSLTQRSSSPVWCDHTTPLRMSRKRTTSWPTRMQRSSLA